MSTSKLVALNDAVMALLKLCKQGYSGSMYMYTDEGQGAIISINTGSIIDVFFRNNRGLAALGELKQAKQVKYFFKTGSTSTARADAMNNDEVFQQLGVSSTARSASELKTVLVVEDSGLARKVLVNALSKKGYYVIEAIDGEEAIEQLIRHKPDLVLLDLILPKKDGYQVLDSMKRHAAQKAIPVIVLTSRSTLLDKLKGKMSASDEYMTKPVDLNELDVKLNKYLG